MIIKELDIVDACAEIKFLNWRDFMMCVSTDLLPFDSIIWRGQKDPNWKLEPTFNRMTKDLDEWGQLEARHQHLQNFKYSARGRRGSNPPMLQTENEWWALGQHYGLATPLLDWTHSPFVAAYFALAEESEITNGNRVVFALHKPTVENHSIEIQRTNQAKPSKFDRKAPMLGMPVKPIEFFKPFSDENQRLVNQSGLFSISNTKLDIESWVREHFVGNSTRVVLMKLLIPSIDREEGLQVLNQMNINHLSLFPDLYGAAKFCNLKQTIDWY